MVKNGKPLIYDQVHMKILHFYTNLVQKQLNHALMMS